MKRSTVLRLAIEALTKRIRDLAPDANLYEMMKMESGKRAYDQVQDLKEARDDLKMELETCHD